VFGNERIWEVLIEKVCATGATLDILETLSSSRRVLPTTSAATIAGCLNALSSIPSDTSLPTEVTKARLNATLAIASLVANRTTAAHDSLATSLIDTLSNAIAAGVLGTGMA
jgi:hypothetical protein